LGQVVCGEKSPGGFELGATTATPDTLLEPFFSFIMMDLTGRRSTRGRGDDSGKKQVRDGLDSFEKRFKFLS